MRAGGVQIPLTGGLVALIDASDVDLVADVSWYAHKSSSRYYAARNVVIAGVSKKVRMHRLIMAAPPELQVDHINGNTLDNRRANLRLCTPAQNKWNRSAPSGSVSGYLGVFRRPSGLWRAKVEANGRKIDVGPFSTPEQAAKARDAIAVRLHGPFATLNFPEAGR